MLKGLLNQGTGKSAKPRFAGQPPRPAPVAVDIKVEQALLDLDDLKTEAVKSAAGSASQR